MKRLLSVLLVFGATVAAAEDSYLYWMVGENASGYTYDTVKVQVNPLLVHPYVERTVI